MTCFNAVRGALLLTAALTCASCATWRDSTETALNEARSRIDQAKAAGAEQYAPDSYKAATQSLNAAQTSFSDGQYADASRQAREAAAAAGLAKAVSDSGDKKAQIEKLRAELAALGQ